MTLRARQILPLVIEYGQDITHTQVTSPLQISPLTDGLRVETGALTVTLNGSGPALLPKLEIAWLTTARPR